MDRSAATVAERILDTDDASLLDVVDNALNKGVVLSGDLTLALAQVDLVYARLSVLLCAADRVLPNEDTDFMERHRARRAGARAAPRLVPELCVYALASTAVGTRSRVRGVAGEALQAIHVGRLDAIVGRVRAVPAPTDRNLRRYDRTMSALWRRHAGAAAGALRHSRARRRATCEAMIRGREQALRRQPARRPPSRADDRPDRAGNSVAGGPRVAWRT